MKQQRLRKRLYLELRLRRLLNAAAAIHYATPLEEEGARSLGLRAPAIVEPNGIDLDEFHRMPSPGSFRELLGLSGESPLVLFLGRLHPKKGLDLLIHAFADVTRGDGVLAIAGTGDASYEKELRRIAEARGLGHRVRFVGFLQGHERIAAYADATVFVLPSHSENFANTVVESVAAGTPVIVSDQVNLHPAVSSSGVGSVVALSRLDLSREIGFWLGEPSRRKSAIADTKSFLEPYALTRVAKKWLKTYQELGESSFCPAST